MISQVIIKSVTPKDENGLPHGEWVSYWENGVIRKISNYNNGKLFGIVKGYEKTGTLSYEFEYLDNVIHGIVNSYNEGLIMNSYMCKNGFKIGREHEYSYFKNKLLCVNSSFNIKNRNNQIIQDGEFLTLTY